MNIGSNLNLRIIISLTIIGLHYYKITHAKVILTEQKRVVDYIYIYIYISRNKITYRNA